MATRRGPLGQLFIGFVLLLIVAAGAGVGLAVFYDDDGFASQLRAAGVPEPRIARVMDLKRAVTAKTEFSGDDLAFTARSIWWDLRDRFDMDLTDRVSRNLPPVRHVTQIEPMARPDDPKEPAGEAPTDAAKPSEETPPRETGEQPAAPPAEEKPAEAAIAEVPLATPTAEEKPEEPPAPPAPRATDKPLDLNNPPAAKPEPAPAAEQTAAVPPAPAPPAAPAEAPPATAEERLAAADLTYKRALSLFADAKSQDQKAEAAKLFAQAAIGGHPGAQYSIGVMHYNGTGVAKDYGKAAEWFGRAAEKSNAAAQYNLGILYYNGQGVPKDDRLAYKWISAAAENGDQKAIVARDALKQALPAEITKPEAPTFPGAVPAGEGAPISVSPTK